MKRAIILLSVVHRAPCVVKTHPLFTFHSVNNIVVVGGLASGEDVLFRNVFNKILAMNQQIIESTEGYSIYSYFIQKTLS